MSAEVEEGGAMRVMGCLQQALRWPADDMHAYLVVVMKEDRDAPLLVATNCTDSESVHILMDRAKEEYQL